MDYGLTNQSKTPFFNYYKAKLKKNNDINKSNNVMYNSGIGQRFGHTFRKETSNDKNNNKKYKTSKNSPNSTSKKIEVVEQGGLNDISGENKDSQLEIIRVMQLNESKSKRKQKNDIFDDLFKKKMKKIYTKKSEQNTKKQKSSSMLNSQMNNGIKADSSLSNSRLLKNKKSFYDNSNFFYNSKLSNPINSYSLEENKYTNANNNSNSNIVNHNGVYKNNINSNYNMNNINNKGDILTRDGNYFVPSSSMKDIYSNNNKYDTNNFDNNNSNNLRDSKNVVNDKGYIGNYGLLKHIENKYENNNCNNNSNNRSGIFKENDPLIKKLTNHHRIRSSAEDNSSNSKMNTKAKRIATSMNYLNNKQNVQQCPRYIVNYGENNHSDINLLNQKPNNVLRTSDIYGPYVEFSKLSKTSYVTKNNPIKNNLDNKKGKLNQGNSGYKYEMRIDKMSDINRFDEVNKSNNNTSGMNLSGISKKKNHQESSLNNNSSSNNNNSSIKHSNNNSQINMNDNNNYFNKTKSNKETLNSYLHQGHKFHHIKGLSDTSNTKSYYPINNLLKSTQISSSNNSNNIIQNNERLSNNVIANSSSSTNMTGLTNNYSKMGLTGNSKYNNYGKSDNNNNNSGKICSLMDKSSSTKNIVCKNSIESYYKNKVSKYHKISESSSNINNNVSNLSNLNGVGERNNSGTLHSSCNNLDLFGGDLIYQKKIAVNQKDFTNSISSKHNNKSNSIIKDYSNNNNTNNTNNSSIKNENSIKARLIKSSVPISSCQSPSEKAEKKIFNNYCLDKIERNKLLNTNNKYNFNSKENNKKLDKDYKDFKDYKDYKDYKDAKNKRDEKSDISGYDKIDRIDININEKREEDKKNKFLKYNDYEEKFIENKENINHQEKNKNGFLKYSKSKEIKINDNDYLNDVQEDCDFNEKNDLSPISGNHRIHNFESKNNLINIPNVSNVSSISKSTIGNNLYNSKSNLKNDTGLSNNRSHNGSKINSPDIKKDTSKNNHKQSQSQPPERKIKGIEPNLINKNNDNNLNIKILEKDVDPVLSNQNKSKDKSNSGRDITNNILIKSSKDKKDTKYYRNNDNDLEKEYQSNIKGSNQSALFTPRNKELEQKSDDGKNKKIKKDIKDIKILKNDKNVNDIKSLIDQKNKANNSHNYKHYNYDMLCEPLLSDDKKREDNTILTTTMSRDCGYYKEEMEKLSMYIKQYHIETENYPDSKIEFYLYGRQIGHGAFGKVNLALHVASGRLVAIKTFAKKHLKNSHAKQKIRNEIEMLSRLRHPFINQILDSFETEKHIFIVMEYVCGDLLGFIRKRGKLSESVSKLIFKQLVEGLRYIHRKKIVHRDIKLDNILIDLTNTVKICDFGVSRKLRHGDIMHEHCGTPAYIAPEIFENKGYEGYQCDIWSAGVTLYYMLAGIQPFRANSIKELETVIMAGKFDPVEEISKEGNDLIKNMLQLDPKKRYTVEEILNHPWLANVDLRNRIKLNLFTEAEKILLSKFDVDYLSSNKEDLIENFTIKNLETNQNLSKVGGNTKSVIFAPYNSYISSKDTSIKYGSSRYKEEKIYKELEVLNDICKFGFKVQQANIKYELSNNNDFDNGVIKTQKEEEFKNQNEKIEKLNEEKILNNKISGLNSPKVRSANDSFEESEKIEIKKDILKQIEQNVGYDRKYIINCIKKNKINYATATYYLLSRENQYIYS